MSKRKITIINGPNLNMLGERDPAVYGTHSLDDIEKACHETVNQYGFEVEFFQSNHEGELVDFIQNSREESDGVIINPAAYTHTSVAIRDALEILSCPIVELHLSNIYKREDFRHKSYVSGIADGIISGFGAYGYVLAIEAMVNILD